ncbi:hypothetical protein L9F63_006163, partial [Diploptera punctata]
DFLSITVFFALRDYCLIASSIITSFSRSNYNTINRPKFKYILFRSCRGRRSYSISTFILIFWSSRTIEDLYDSAPYKRFLGITSRT